MPSRSTLDAQSSHHRSEEESQPIPQAQHRSRAPSLPLAPTRYQLTDWQCHSKPLSQRKLRGPVGGSAFWSAAARCAPHAILKLLHTVTVSRPPDTPFQRVMRVLHQQQQQTSCPCFRFLSPCTAAPCPPAPTPSGPMPAGMRKTGPCPFSLKLCAPAAARR